MGKIRNGILGTVTGKVGGVVARTWKGTNTLASYQPNVSNPQTAGQVAQRTKMKAITLLASTLNTLFIKPLWDRFAKGMSGYNAFIQKNIAAVSAAGIIDFTKLVLSQGKMTAPVITDYQIAGMVITVDWDVALPDAYSLATDKAYICILNNDGIIVGSSVGTVSRSAGTVDIVTQEPYAGYSHCYLAFRRIDGTVVSDSSYATYES